MFETYTFLLLSTTAIGIIWGVTKYRDTLHPLLFLMPVSAYMYGFRPLIAGSGELSYYFKLAELDFIQALNLAGVVALAMGCVAGSNGLRRNPARIDLHSFALTNVWMYRLRVIGISLGLVGLGLYVYGLTNVGGFVDAYNAVKGGGRAASGYLRDFTLLVIPATLFLFLGVRKPMSWKYRLIIALYSSPLLVHGLLSARRGPTFMGLATLGIGWYLSRNKRPSLLAMIGGGAGIGLLLIALVTFRGQIYLGSDLLSGKGPSISAIVAESLEEQTEVSAGNEYVYGTYAALQAKEEGDHFWGSRYLTYIFIRPIPSFIWPTKYEDVGMESLLVNSGTLGSNESPSPNRFRETPEGAAPGFISDLFVEFRWGMIPAAFGFGWLFGFFWRRSISHGGIWMIIHVCALVLSLYFISQTVEAILFRFLVITIPAVMIWQSNASRFAPWAKLCPEVLGSRSLRSSAPYR